MAAQWTKYVITGKRYDSQRSRIEFFHVRQYSAEGLTDPVVYSRQQVLSLINSGEKFVTATPSTRQGYWDLGEDIRPVPLINGRYLRTDNNQVEADNLGNLQEF